MTSTSPATRGAVIITGASGGIGAAVAHRLAAAGFGVIANDVGVTVAGDDPTPSAAENLAADIRANGGQAVANHDSVASHSAAEALVRTAVEQYGSLAGLVTCHGILRERMVFNMSEDEWSSVVDVHLNGTFNCVRFATAQMRTQRSGSVVLLGSAAGMEGSPAQANYAAAKAGIVGLAYSSALAMGRYDVNVNCIVPAAATRMTSRLNDRMQGSRPDDERQGPELIAELALTLVEPANRTITGQVFTAAGRRLARWEAPRETGDVHVSDDFGYDEVEAAVRERVGYEPLRRFASLGLAEPQPLEQTTTPTGR